jgi:hypothetical protein
MITSNEITSNITTSNEMTSLTKFSLFLEDKMKLVPLLEILTFLNLLFSFNFPDLFMEMFPSTSFSRRLNEYGQSLQ